MMKSMFKRSAGVLIVFVFVSLTVFAQRDLAGRPTESGGVLLAEQAAYDVRHYDLALRVFPDERAIKGVLTVRARIVNSIDKFVLDLDTPLTVETVALVRGKKETPLTFERREGKIWINFPSVQKAGKTVEVRVVYGGKPRVAPAPPWAGGFVWSKTAADEHWFATAVQMDGSDLWFPVKDHPSDKPETTSLHFTVPANLVAASNGKLQSVVDNKDGTRTFNWFLAQPISNYNIALNVAPYKLIEDEMKSVTGETIPIKFYVLPESFEKGKGLVEKTKDYVRFFEEYLGPFPFRTEKLGIAETPHLGMEHQTIIAYGNAFNYTANGFDFLMFHELGHEWWANLVTAPDWNDFWIHEGFQSFMDNLYAEKIMGREFVNKTLPNRIRSLKNVKALAPRQPRTTTEMYLLPPEYTKSDNDIYGKGALVLNSLRGLVGDDAFFKSLRKMAYPNEKLEKVTNGKQVRFATTDDFLQIVEKETGRDLDWFFNVYLRQPVLPKLIVEETASGEMRRLNLRWETPDGLPFPMPVEVKIGGEIVRVEMPNGTAKVEIPVGKDHIIDPNGWLLKAL